jgi:hypothetical protein
MIDPDNVPRIMDFGQRSNGTSHASLHVAQAFHGCAVHTQADVFARHLTESLTLESSSDRPSSSVMRVLHQSPPYCGAAALSVLWNVAYHCVIEVRKEIVT